MEVCWSPVVSQHGTTTHAKKLHKTKTHPNKTAHTREDREGREALPPACSYLLVPTLISCWSKQQVGGGGGVSRMWSTCCRHSWLFFISAQRQQPREETQKILNAPASIDLEPGLHTEDIPLMHQQVYPGVMSTDRGNTPDAPAGVALEPSLQTEWWVAQSSDSLEWQRRENTPDQRWENREKSLVGQQIRVMWPQGRSSLAS